jgi:hypothetical protein
MSKFVDFSQISSISGRKEFGQKIVVLAHSEKCYPAKTILCPNFKRYGTGMVNVKKNYVINGKIYYLMIIFDYHYQIKINVNFSHGLS